MLRMLLPIQLGDNSTLSYSGLVKGSGNVLSDTFSGHERGGAGMTGL